MRCGMILLLLFLFGSPTQAEEDENKQAAAPKPDPRLEMAAQLRRSVVRVVWHAKADHQIRVERHAVVASSGGLLVMAGPPPDVENGYLNAHLHDERQLRASVRKYDSASALTVLSVRAENLEPVRFAPRSPSPQPTAKAPLASLPIGASITMVTAEGAVAFGRVRSQDLEAEVVDPNDGTRGRVTSLVEAALAAVASDLGAPWFDEQGQVVGLLVGGAAESNRDKQLEARKRRLALRSEPTAALAIPASVVEVVLPFLARRRAVPRAYIGIGTRPAPEEARAHVLEGRHGHIVHALKENSPAAKAGLAEYDIIVSVNGHPLRPRSPMHDVLLPYRPEEEITLGIVRGREEHKLTVKLGTRPPAPARQR